MRCRIEGEMTIDDDPLSQTPRDTSKNGGASAFTEEDVMGIVERALTLYSVRHPRPRQVNMPKQQKCSM